MRLLLAGLLVTAAVLMARNALAIDACTAADIVSQESDCSATGVTCTITKQYTVGDGCTLDFSGRNVAMTPTSILTIGSGQVTLVSNDLTLAATAASGASINGRGTGSSAPTNQGGNLVINATGDVTIQKSGFTRARIEVSATDQAGTIQINAGGTVTIAGRLEADQEPNALSASGGMIVIRAGKDIISQAGSQILAGGGSTSYGGGGTLDFAADGKIDLGDIIDVSGSEGGTVTLSAQGDVIVRGIAGSADTISGATVDIEAGQGVQLLDHPIYLNGSDDQGEDNDDNDGGTLTLDAQNGNLVIAADIYAEGRGPESSGGIIEISVQGSLTVTPGTTISVHSYGYYSFAGEIDLTADQSLTMAGRIDAIGGQGTGIINIGTGGDATISGPLEASAFGAGSDGGGVTIEAGLDLVVSNTIDVSVGSGRDSGAGETDLAGCNVTLTTTGKILARGPCGGENDITAREQLRVDGFVNALHIGSPTSPDVDGINSLVFPDNRPPLIRPNVIQPPAMSQALPRCSAVLSTDCLDPCAGIPCGSDCTPAPTGSPTLTPALIPTATPESTPTSAPTELPVPTLTETPVVAETPTATATPVATQVACPGDCDGDGAVTVNEIVAMVSVALGTADISTCPAGDGDGNLEISVNDIVQAVTNLLSGCV